MDMDITLTTRIGVPDGSMVEYGATGAVIGFRMPCGRVVRPWVTLEIEEDDNHHDLTYDEQMALGIDTTSSDTKRQVSEALD